MSQGHSFHEVVDYTTEQLQTLTQLASKRVARELAATGQAMAVGAATGMSGDIKPLQEWTKRITGELQGHQGIPREMQASLMRMVEKTREQRGSDGSGRSNTRRPPRSPNRKT